MAVTLYIGRHGETDLNSEDKLRGWLDVPLNDDGIKEAERMAKKMEDVPLDRIYTSDLDRADHTAQIIAKNHQIIPIPRSWFRPINFGEWNGRKISDIKDKMQQLLDQWKTDPEKSAPGGESFEDFQDRNLGGLQAVMRAANDGDEIMIAAHLRNAKLFNAVAEVGHPLRGEDLKLMEEDGYHQGSGEIAKYLYGSDGRLIFKEKI